MTSERLSSETVRTIAERYFETLFGWLAASPTCERPASVVLSHCWDAGTLTASDLQVDLRQIAQELRRWERPATIDCDEEPGGRLRLRIAVTFCCCTGTPSKQ
jgi:hypothetical protein